jgi:heat shock protein HslJ
VVEDLDHRGIIDRSRLTLAFDADGRVSGRGGCNTFTGRYVLSGEALTIHEAVFTQKACVSALMAQEARFIGLLREVSGFDINGQGALVLLAGARRALLARL